jgi:hypothetical protein
MARHLDLLGMLFFVYAAFQTSIACVVGGLYGLMGGGVALMGVVEQEGEAILMGGVMLFFAMFMGIMLLIQPVLAMLAAVGIRRRTTTGRILGLIAACLFLLNIPLGTALGIFALFVLVDKEAAAEFTPEGRLEHFT